MTANLFEWKLVLRPLVVTVAILLIPLIAMRFTEEVQWTVSDFTIMGTLLFGIGFAYEVVSRKGSTGLYRGAVGMALFATLLLIWMNGAVGIIGSENNPANLLYAGVPLTLVIGAVLARLKAQSMAYALFATAFVQFMVPVTALIIWRPDFSPGVLGVFILNAFFVALYFVSGLLFSRAHTSLVR